MVIQIVLFFYKDKPVYPLGTLSIFPFNGLPRKVAVNVSENKEDIFFQVIKWLAQYSVLHPFQNHLSDNYYN